MATYRLKRKNFNAITDTAGNVVGGALNGVGRVMDSGVGSMTGAALGAYAGANLLGDVIPMGGIIGGLAGASLGSTATRQVGKGLKASGQDLMA